MRRTKVIIKEIERAEHVNPYGVKIINRLVEETRPSGKTYIWIKDMIQTDGSRYSSTMFRYVQKKRMLDMMERFNFFFESNTQLI